MVSRPNNTYHQPRISDMDKKYFREIFNLEARGGHEGHRNDELRIDFDALNRIFNMVGFEPNQKQIAEF